MAQVFFSASSVPLRRRFSHEFQTGSASFAALSRIVALATFVIRSPALGVSLRRDRQIRLLAALPLLEQFLEERHAPLAPRARAQAFAHLRRHAGRFALDEVDQFALAHAKAQADMII